ncbi:hypothetical protein M514_04586 [Trichuris suis]|uniref:Dynein light chain n=1 Tax=Trichuris suis TaxID=68888 RepID=A0A085NV07_9BILA|nr:hypothetical protein M514_04586 [Trichuris suis]KHJ45483.1 dynein light chain type 1 [Trichuris suis]
MDYEMTEEMLEVAVLKAKEALDKYDDEEEMMKTFFDNYDCPSWQVIVGRSFGVDITHDYGSFAYFSLRDIAFLIFRNIR